MGPTWGPSESCRPQMGPMLAPWILLSGLAVSVKILLIPQEVTINIIAWNIIHDFNKGIESYRPYLNPLTYFGNSEKFHNLLDSNFCNHTWTKIIPQMASVLEMVRPYRDACCLYLLGSVTWGTRLVVCLVSAATINMFTSGSSTLAWARQTKPWRLRTPPIGI